MEYTGSSYVGERKNGRLEGVGEYTFPTGTKYKGQLKDGQFHGHGVLHFPNGGRFEAEWDEGVATGGSYTYADGLQYEEKDWDYCTEEDRRFFSERIYGLKPAGKSQLTNSGVCNAIPTGTYDCGDGFYNPKDGKIYNYSGAFLRNPEEGEPEWIVKTCRRA